MMVIKTKRFILRPFRKGDEFTLAKNINNKKIYKYTQNIPYPYTLDHARVWVKVNLKEQKRKKPKKLNFVIEIDREVAGSIGFNKIYVHKAEIGYWLAEKYWDNGIMTQSLKLVSKFGFEKLKLKSIFATVFYSNKASARVLGKAGYKKEGLLKNHIIKDKKLKNVYLFTKLK
ncbi:GNAT family N-acetyltransferase [Patescibacteria group bacterium]|nr:GNAT family N-acetyltransferase [Patescibacteria group bacterium]